MTGNRPLDPQPPPRPEDAPDLEALLRQVRDLEAQSASRAAHQRPMEALTLELQEMTLSTLPEPLAFQHPVVFRRMPTTARSRTTYNLPG